MKLLLISVKSQISRGGIAVWTDRFLSRCAGHGIDCTLVNTEIVGKRAVQGTAHRSIVDEIIRTRRIFKDLKKALKEHHDAAHLNTSCGTFGLFRDYLIARKITSKGIPLVTHYHCDIPYWIHNPVSRAVLGKLATLSHQNLVLCENSRRYLQEQFGIESGKVPNFLEDTLIQKETKRTKENPERIFFVGRVEEAKGAAEMYALAKRFPKLCFVLVGEISQQVAQWEKPENILLLGGMPHSQVIEQLDQADIFLFPSHSEGFSVALMEAMARGIPCIATDVGANADMLADGCGIVVAKGDVDAMEQAIAQLQDAQLRSEMSCRAVNKVRTYYTTDAVMLRIKSMY